MISALFIFNGKGDVLISRIYRHDVKRSLSDLFRIHVISNSQVKSPITTLGSTSFYHIKHENIFLAAVSKSNANVALIFEFLIRLAKMGTKYFNKFDEESVKNNFTLVYELLEEVCDFGYPQNTEMEALKKLITTESVKKDINEGKILAIQATGAVSWRRPDIKYRKNEAFIDVIESVNLLVSSNGNVLRSDVYGVIMMRAYLSGMPECKFGLNDRNLIEAEGSTPRQSNNPKNLIALDDCHFHHCVKLASFEETKTINFIPPDGEFELMNYRSTQNINLPFKLQAIVNELSSGKVEYNIVLRSQFPSNVYAQNIILKIPTPENTASTKLSASGGKSKYSGSDNCIIWKIARMQGGTEISLVAFADLSYVSIKKPWIRPPISLDFQVLMFSSSGLVVRYLRIFEKSNYNTIKWVRYMSKAGSYQFRI